MAERKPRRAKSIIIQEKLESAKQKKTQYEERIAALDEEIKKLEEELNAQRVDEVISVINEQGLSIEDAITKLKS